MGQTASYEANKPKYIEKTFHKNEIRTFFQNRVALLFTPKELALFTARLKQLNDSGNSIIDVNDLESILTLKSNLRTESRESGLKFSGLHEATGILYLSFVALGQLPFLKDSLNDILEPRLNASGLLMAGAVHTGRLGKLWPEFDQLTLFFISLAISQPSVVEKDTTKSESYVVKLLDCSHGQAEVDEVTVLGRNIQWRSFDPLTLADDLDLESLTVSFHALLKVFTILLVFSSIDFKPILKLREDVIFQITENWTHFEASALTMLRIFDPNLTAKNCKLRFLTLADLSNSSRVGIPNLVTLAMNKIFKFGLLLAIDTPPDSNEQKNLTGHLNKNTLFSESRLLKQSTIAVLSTALSVIDNGPQLSSKNLVELYNGSRCGFSLRSLELRIFKWQASTILLVSGKRLKRKTMETNKRYHTFDSEFPRWFRLNESHTRTWQSELDVITYAVFISHPWTHSNKSNFGNNSTTIIALLPRFDIFVSKKGLPLGNKLVYFNTLGMGLGFGNDQPINKNSLRKYQPGSISLTIDSNLEFAVFRHLPNNNARNADFFETSNNKQLPLEDYEDRFMITDLEVWGVGSSKELEEQRKQWEWEEKQAMTRQSVNIRNIGEDRAFLEMAGLVGNHAGGGSI